MPSKKELRQLAIEREYQRRNQAAADACPMSRADFSALVDHVSDYLVDHGHKHDFEVTIAYLKDQNLPVDATISFLAERRITDDWGVLVNGDPCGIFGPSSDRRVRMPLEETELEELIDWVDGEVELTGCDHTHRLTRSWLAQRGIAPTRTIGTLMALGGFCDCEVAMNVEPEGIYFTTNSRPGTEDSHIKPVG